MKGTPKGPKSKSKRKEFGGGGVYATLSITSFFSQSMMYPSQTYTLKVNNYSLAFSSGQQIFKNYSLQVATLLQ
jgi:hypothetical protein